VKFFLRAGERKAIGAWLKQRARIKPSGKSLRESEQRKPLPPLISFVRRATLKGYFLHQSGRNPQIIPSSGQYTTAEGEADIPRFCTRVSAPQFVPSGE
jgi:hypothetical protein